jgi:hypothetical protein
MQICTCKRRRREKYSTTATRHAEQERARLKREKENPGGRPDEATGAAASDVEVGGRRSCEPFRAPHALRPTRHCAVAVPAANAGGAGRHSGPGAPKGPCCNLHCCLVHDHLIASGYAVCIFLERQLKLNRISIASRLV